MKRCLILLTLALGAQLVAPREVNGQIRSNTSGGNWNATTTWEGGVVPGGGDQVTIRGTVLVNATATVGAVTVESGARLQNDTGDRTLRVLGNFVNDGTVADYTAASWFYLDLEGNVTNNGTWTNRQNYLRGSSDQTLSHGTGSTFGAPLLVSKDAGTLTAGSDLDFSNGLDLGGGSLESQGYSMTVRGAGHVRNGAIAGPTYLAQYDETRWGYEVLQITGQPEIRGRVNVGNSVSFEGTLVVADTLQNTLGCDCLVTVEGDLVNNGTIRDSQPNYWLSLRVTGDLTNNGSWNNHETQFTGTGDQTIAHSPDAIWLTPFESTKDTGRLLAGNDLDFSSPVNLNEGTLDTQGYGVTVRGSGYVRNGVIAGPAFLAQYDETRSGYEGLRITGQPEIRGRVNAGNGLTFEGTLVVADTLQNVSSCDCTIIVEGDLVNNGTIRDSQPNYWLFLWVTGDLTNNGTWSNKKTWFKGSGEQIITQSPGSTWLTPFESDKDAGSLRAGSDLDFSKTLDLSLDSLYADTYNLTVRGEGSLADAIVFMDGGDLAQYDGVVGGARNSTFRGNLTVRGKLSLWSENVFEGSLVVADTLQNLAGCDCHNYVEDIVNNGVIRNEAPNFWLFLHVRGDLVNNGEWAPYRTYLDGSGDQHVSQADGTTFAGPVESLKESGYTYLGSDLDLSASLDLNYDSLYAGQHGVTVRGEGYVFESTLFMDGIFSQQESGRSAIQNSRLDGKTVIRDKVHLGPGATFGGTLVVVDTLQNVAGCDCQVLVEGSVENHGVIRDVAPNYWLFLTITGSIHDWGEWENKATYFSGDGLRTWYAPEATTPFAMTEGEVVLTGDNALSNLLIVAEDGPTLASGARLLLKPGVDDKITNHGEVYQELDVTAGGTIPLYRADLRIVPAALDSLYVSHFGNQAPYTFANAVRSYWTVRSVPEESANTLEWIDLAYVEDELGDHGEEELQVYHSDDLGQTWRQVSTLGNLERHPDGDYVRLTGASAAGTYALSSSADNVTVLPTVIPTVIGRDQIRLGPPNRYTVHYANNSDVPTGDMMLLLTVDRDVHIDHIEPSGPAGVDSKWLYPEDFGIYGDSTVAPPDTTALLLVQSMAPHEERSFDVVLNAFPDGWTGKSADGDEAMIVPVIGVALWWAGTGLVTAYTTDVTFNVLEESFARTDGAGPVIQEALRKTNAKWFSFEKPATELVKDLALTWGQGVIGGTLGTASVVAVKVGEGLYNFLKAVACGGDRYVNGRQTISACVDKPVEKVTSWDPNEKVGPGGVGDEGYVTDASRMTYQILFENKAEAGAPAWKIVVDDTLAAVFDPSTVRLEGESHTGFEFTQVGSALHWEVTGIDLPPNVTPPEGEGYVQFSVQTVDGLTSGTALENHAVIVFDFNDPIVTNTFVNTLDFEAPVTAMEALSQQVVAGELTVRWTATDGVGESGVLSTNLFMSEDGGPFVSVGSTFADSLVVPVEADHEYAFYALSKDAVGNAETSRPDLATVQVVATAVEDDVPFEFALGHAYPNPFNPVTTVTYTLPQTGPAELTVYDAVGRQVAVLLRGGVVAGPGSVRWDASGMASGIYFYRMQQGAHAETRAMVLLK